MKEQPDSNPKSETSIADELGQFLDGQQGADDTLSSAFQRAVAEPLRDEDLHKVQLQTRLKVDSLDRLVRKLKRDLLITNLLLAMMVVACASGVGILYKRLPSIAQSGAPTTASNMAHGSSIPQSGQPGLIPDPAAFVTAGEPLSKADLTFFPLLLDLFRRANGFRRNSEATNIDNRSDDQDQYLRFLTDVTEVAERGAEERVSDELLGLVVKITQLAQQNRSKLGAPAIETDLLNEEIQSVLRDYSARARLPKLNQE